MKQQTAEDWFKEQISGCVGEIDIKKCSYKIHFFKNDKLLLIQDIKRHMFWLCYEELWSVLESKYQIKDQQINHITKVILEQHFKCKVEYATASSLQRYIKYI